MAPAKATIIVALVGALALLASVANALTWTSPTPQFNTYDATSTISGPFVAQSGDQTYAAVQVFASYALGAPCSGTKECSACVGSGTGPIDYSCPCTIDFAANVTVRPSSCLKWWFLILFSNDFFALARIFSLMMDVLLLVMLPCPETVPSPLRPTPLVGLSKLLPS